MSEDAPVRSPRSFYPNAWAYLALAFLAVVAGFFPSYFARLGTMDAAYHLHGLTASLWMLLLVVQPLLHRMGRWDVHRRLGRVGFLLVPAVVVSGMVMIHRMLESPDRYPAAMAHQLAFIDFFVLGQFVLFFALGMSQRKNMDLHARYMIGTVFGVLIPALTRLLIWLAGVPTFGMALHLSYVLVYAVLVALLVHDRRTGGVRVPYALAFGLMAVQHVGMTFAPSWTWWAELMGWVASLGST